MGERAFPAAGLIPSAVLTAGVVLTLLLGWDSSAWAQAPTLIRSAVDRSRTITLAGNTRPEANPQNDRGPVSDSLAMEHMLLQLRRSADQELALSKLIEQLHNPASANFHQWLTAQDFGQKFGLSQQDLNLITQWLESSGFKVNAVSPSGVTIDFSGTAGQIRAAFGTEIHRLWVNGAAHIANMSDPRIPAALAPAIVGIASLNDFRPRQMRKLRGELVGNGNQQLIAPADLAAIYNLNPLFGQGITGAGQTIAVVEDSNVFNTGDWSTFRSIFGLSGYPGTFTTVHPGNCTDPGVTADDGEAVLDAEWASAAAPGAAIMLASCGNAATFGGLLALQNLVNGANPPSIVSVSYGECEANNGAAGNAAYSSIYQQAVTEGISVFVAAGDEGSADCDAGASKATHGIAVNGFASTPYNVAVGGTDFGDTYAGTTSTYWNGSNGGSYGSARSYIPEIPWNNSCASVLLATKYGGSSQTYGATGFCNSAGGTGYQNIVAGGGGPSGCATGSPATHGVVGGTCAGYAKPSWQSGFAGIASDGVRDIPDISLFAANGIWGHFYVYCDSDGGSCSGAPNTWAGAGGTSFSSPIMAGIQALINQKAGAQGNPNYTYYSLAAQEYGSSGSASCNSSNGNAVSGSCIFYDVTLGDNDVNCSGTQNCYLPSGTLGVLSTTRSSYAPAYGAATGWDFATGIGSLNAFNLVNNWPGSVGLTYTISGRVTLSGNGLAGVTVMLNGSSSNSTTTNSAGNFSFSGLAAGGSYTVTPSLNGYGFTPSSLTFPNLNAGQVANFTAATATQILIQTVPAGLQFSVDNSPALIAPQTVNLSAGQHTIAVATQGDGAGTQYVFASWSDGGQASHIINVAGPASYTATFQVQYQLTISASPTIGGTATPASGTFYNAGSTVPVSAIPNAGYLFANWSGNVNSFSSASTSVTMNGPQTITANFSTQPSVTIQTSPEGLQFSVDGGAAMIAPQSITLAAGAHTIAVASSQSGGAGTQYIFNSWSDGGAASHLINVTGSAVYTASFQTQYQLTASASPSIGGTVTPASGNFYNAGTVVPVSASASSGYGFANWSGNVADSGSASTSVTMNAPQTVTAHFQALPSITIQTSPQGLLFSVDGGPSQIAPQTVILAAGPHTIAVPGSQSGGAGTQYIFNAWSDSNTAASRIVNVTGPATYTATFQAQYQLTIAASPAAGGSVTPGSGIFYNAGTVVSVNAAAATGYTFANWSGNVANSGSFFTSVTMNAPQNLTANFALTACSFSLSATSATLPATGTSSAGFYPSAPQSFTISPNSGCGGVSWSAATADISPAGATPSAFVFLTSSTSGTGPATLSFNAFANTHLAARSATITITPSGGSPATFTVNEEGSAQSMLNRETQALYQRALGREPDPSGFSFWTCTTPATVNPCSNLGVSGLGQMVDLFLQSPEGMNSDFQVLALYQAFLGRLPGFAEWAGAIAPFRANDTPAGWSAAATALVNTLTHSGEYSSRYGSPDNTVSAISNLYQNLLQRQPTNTELLNGVTVVTSSGLPSLFTALFTGTEFRNTGAFASGSAASDHSNNLFVTMIYFAVLARDPDPGGYAFWVGVANSGGAGIYFQPVGTTGGNMRFQVEGPGSPNQGLVGSIEFQSLFAN